MKLLVLDTGLFPDRETLQLALDQLGPEHEVSRYDANAGLTDDDWDHFVRELACCDRIITL